MDEGGLLSNFLAGQGADSPAPSGDDMTTIVLQQARTLLDVVGLRGAAMALDHAGHGNYLGFQSTFESPSTASIPSSTIPGRP